MRRLHRRSRSASSGTSTVLEAVDLLGEDVPGPLAPGLVDVEAASVGLIVRRREQTSSDAPTEVPSLLPWDGVAGLTADECVALDGGRSRQVLAVDLSDGNWFASGQTVRFGVSAATVGTVLSAAASRGVRVPGPARSGPRTALIDAWQRMVAWTQIGGTRRRLAPVAAGVAALVLLSAGASPIFESPASSALGRAHRVHARDHGNASEAAGHPSAHLAAATTAPNPAPPSLAGSPPLQSHEIFGYAPYWTLPQSSSFDVNNLTTLAYFSIDANGDGTLNQSGSGWNGYQSQDLVNLVNRSHAAGDRVVLTVTCFSQSALDAITSDPNAAGRLSSALINAVAAKNLDGVNFDFEGEGSADRAGLTSLITKVSAALHGANPHWQVTMATYASAAADSAGFYDIAGLAPALDGFFVMAYDMNDRSSPSPTAPLIGGSFNDTEALQQFTAVVPPQKVILGVPYYGYDWPTTDGSSTAQATGSESPLSASEINASGHPTYWDPTTQTPWTSYLVGTQWHETYFDDPTSLALKAQLASQFHIAGLGIWALGMDGNDPAMLAALLGSAPAAKDGQLGPPPGPVGTGFASTATWQGAAIALTPINAPPSGGTLRLLGTLSAFATTDPALACLQSGPPLNVWSFSTLPGVAVVWATQPGDCADAFFAFQMPPPPANPGTTTSTSSTTTTSVAPPTTQPPPTTTTTSPPPPTTTTSTTTTSTSTTTTSTTLPPGP